MKILLDCGLAFTSPQVVASQYLHPLTQMIQRLMSAARSGSEGVE
jgi:hypothetical protein